MTKDSIMCRNCKELTHQQTRHSVDKIVHDRSRRRHSSRKFLNRKCSSSQQGEIMVRQRVRNRSRRFRKGAAVNRAMAQPKHVQRQRRKLAPALPRVATPVITVKDVVEARSEGASPARDRSSSLDSSVSWAEGFLGLEGTEGVAVMQ